MTERHAALSALSQMSAPCKKLLKKELATIIPTLINISINDIHPRCKYAAIHTIAMLSNECKPLVQQNILIQLYHHYYQL